MTLTYLLETRDLSSTLSDRLCAQTYSGSDDVIPPSSPADGGMVQMCRYKHAGNLGRTRSDLLSKKMTRNRRTLSLSPRPPQPAAEQTFTQDKYLRKMAMDPVF